jgi:translation initiation factor 2 alpha subunit (eIF-2alpha)
MANKSGGASKVSQANNYKTSRRWESNRIRRLKKLLAKHPNNKQLELAIKNVHYRRKTPKNQEWSKTQIYIAKLFKMFAGYVDRDMFSNNEKLSQQATLRYHPHPDYVAPKWSEKSMFSIGARAQLRSY